MGKCFHFKRFSVCQQGAAMKVGTDGVLLGAWFSVGNGGVKILDAGTGTGLIALMAAQRNSFAGIDGIDLEPGAVMQARENAANSPWNDRINILEISLQRYAREVAGLYDIIVSNPPYFENSLPPPGYERTLARHSVGLTKTELAECSSLLLRDGGTLAVVFPTDSLAEFTAAAFIHGLRPLRICEIKPREGLPPARSLAEYVKTGEDIDCHVSKLAIEKVQRHDYTGEYKELTRDFYLKF